MKNSNFNYRLELPVYDQYGLTPVWGYDSPEDIDPNSILQANLLPTDVGQVVRRNLTAMEKDPSQLVTRDYLQLMNYNKIERCRERLSAPPFNFN